MIEMLKKDTSILKKATWKQAVVFAALCTWGLYPFMHSSSYIMHIIILVFIWGIVAESWNLLMGYAGVFSLGNIGFLAIGGYSSGILTKYLGFSPWPAVFCGGLITMATVTIFLGLPALRLGGIYIALLSLIFTVSLPSILTQTRAVTGGAMGLHDIPPLFPSMERIDAYYIIFAAFIVILFCIYKIINSKTGTAFVALRDCPELAAALGVNAFFEKLKAFAASSFFTGIAGGFYVHYLGDISPTTLSIEPFLLTIAMMEVGGLGRFPGGVLGAIFIVCGNEFLRLSGTFRMAILGALICIIILFFSGGLMQLVDWCEGKLSSFLNLKSSGSRKRIINIKADNKI